MNKTSMTVLGVTLLLAGAGIGYAVAALVPSSRPGADKPKPLPPSSVLRSFDPETLLAKFVPPGATTRSELPGGQDRASRLQVPAGYLFGKHAAISWKEPCEMDKVQKALWSEVLASVTSNGGVTSLRIEDQAHSWAPYEADGIAGVIHLWTFSEGDRHTIALSIHETQKGALIYLIHPASLGRMRA